MASVGGLLLIDKPKGWTSHDCVAVMRKRVGLHKIGHAGTLDPFATGLLILLIGRKYTSQAEQLQGHDKSYWLRIRLGQSTDTQDCEGQVLTSSDVVPTQQALEEALSRFQGDLLQLPPMFSAKKIDGQKLYNLARKGRVVERVAHPIRLSCQLLQFEYPWVELHVDCTKGSYMRTVAHDLGELLGCGAHASELRRLRSGSFAVEQAISLEQARDPNWDLTERLLTEVPYGSCSDDRNL